MKAGIVIIFFYIYRYSSIFIDQYDPNDEIVKKINDIYKYKVNEDNIVILNKNERKGIPCDCGTVH